MKSKQIVVVATLLLGAVLANWGIAQFGTARRQLLLRNEFVIFPGHSPSGVQFELTDSQLVEIDRTGKLLLHVKGQEERLVRPIAYQMIAHTHHDVDVKFAMNARGEVRFIAGPYDTSLPLVIDTDVK